MQREQERRHFDLWLKAVTPLWTWTWPYLVYVQKHLDKITSGECKRLMLFLPPRSGKSQMTTIRYPVWRLEREPELRVIIGAYNQPLANSFARLARRIAEKRFALSGHVVDDWETTQGGGVRAVGVGSGITGRGGDLIIIDDPVKSREEAESAVYRERLWEWYRDDLYTRLEPNGAIILIQTRWHADDLAGRILASEDGPNWTQVALPAEAEANDPLERPPGAALCPDRYGLEALARIRLVLGEYSYNALYQQHPVSPLGGIYQRDWWTDQNRYDATAPYLINTCVGRWLSLDTAFKGKMTNDPTACGVYEMLPDYRLLKRHAWVKRLEFPDLLGEIERTATRFNRDGKLRGIIIEDAASGISALQTLRAAAPGWLAELLIGFTPPGSKLDRGRQASLWCERGRVLLPEPSDEVPWLFDFERELFAFPSGAHDDQCDEWSQVILYLTHYIAAGWQATIRGLVNVSTQ